MRSHARVSSDVEPGRVKGERRVRVLSALSEFGPGTSLLDILTTPVTRIRRFFLFGFFRDCVCMVRDAFFSRRSERNQPYSLPTLRDFRVETRVQHRLVEMLCRFSRTLARA